MKEPIFTEFELRIDRPADAIEAIQKQILSDAELKYQDANIKVLHSDCKSLLDDLETVKIKVEQFKEKSITVENLRAENLATWNSFTKSLQTLCNKHKIDLPDVAIPQAVGREFATKIMNSSPNLALYNGKRIPTHLDTSKLDELLIEEHTIIVNYEICRINRNKQALIIKEILESA